MPIQIWTHDRSPELRLAGSQMLAGGISNAGRGIGNAIERYQERKAQQEEERKRIASAAKASSSLLKALNDEERGTLELPDPSEFAMLDPASQVSTMTGAMQAFGAKQAIGGLREKLLEREAQAQAAQRRAQFNANLLPRLAGIGQPPREKLEDFYENATDESQRPQRQVPPQVLLLEEAARAGVLDPSRIDPDALLKATEGAGPRDDFFTRDQFGRAIPVIGPDGKAIPGLYNNVLGPKQAQMFTDPTSGMQTTTITDAAGNQHTVLVQPGQRPQFAPSSTAGTITPEDRLRSLTAQYNALIDRRRYSEADAVNRQIQELMGGRGETPAEAPGAKPDAKPAPDAELEYDPATKTLKPRK